MEDFRAVCDSRDVVPDVTVRGFTSTSRERDAAGRVRADAFSTSSVISANRPNDRPRKGGLGRSEAGKRSIADGIAAKMAGKGVDRDCRRGSNTPDLAIISNEAAASDRRRMESSGVCEAAALRTKSQFWRRE